MSDPSKKLALRIHDEVRCDTLYLPHPLGALLIFSAV